jgi:predicted methyltransferase
LRRALSAVALAALAVSLGVACRSSSPAESRDKDAARLLLTYLERGERSALDDALERLGPRPTGPFPSSQSELVDSLARYLAAPEDQRAAIAGSPLYHSVLRELAADGGALAKLVLALYFFGAPESNDLGAPVAFARTLANCAFTSRVVTEDPAVVAGFMGLAEGDVVADVGAGPGFFTFHFARAVGESGRVYAVEIPPQMIAFLERHAAEQDIHNVTVVRGLLHDTRLPEGVADHAFMTHMFVDIESHYPLSRRQTLYATVLRALRPGGRFTVCEPNVPGRPLNLTQDEVVARLEGYGFRDDARQPPGGPYGHMNCVRVVRPQAPD